MHYFTYVHERIDQFGALSDETRFRILRVLLTADTPLCVAEIVDIVRRPQYAVSRALGVLAKAQLVSEEHRGKLRLYGALRSPMNAHVFAAVSELGKDGNPWPLDDDRLRWRLELRQDGECVVTYTEGYAPQAYSRSEQTMDNRPKERVLFICVHNTARSQMAEAYLRHFAGDIFETESAGLTPGTLNPYVMRVMEEDGFDISHKVPQSVFDLYRNGRSYSYVVTVCSREAEEGCPVFPGPVRRISWPFADPASFSGTDEEIMEQTRHIRDEIRGKVQAFANNHREEHAK